MDNASNLPSGTRSDSFGRFGPSGSQNAVMLLSGLPESFFVPMPAVTRVLAQFDRRKLGAAIEVMIALLDVTDGDCDAETNGDERDASWHENPGAGCTRALLEPHEDAEDDDSPEDDDPAGGNPEDEGEHEDGDLCPAFGIDQAGTHLNHFLGGETVPDLDCTGLNLRR